MRIGIKIGNGQSIVKVAFSSIDRELLDKKMEKLSYGRESTNTPFGIQLPNGEKWDYWHSNKWHIRDLLDIYSVPIIDDIKKPLWHNEWLNIALFRIIKDKFSITIPDTVNCILADQMIWTLKKVFMDIISIPLSYELNMKFTKEE